MNENQTVGNKIVTIQDAIAAYKNCNAESEGYRQILALLIDAGFDREFQNDSYFDALILTEAMLNRTSHNINILTGGACGGFYSTLLEHLTSALERVRTNNGSAKMIVHSTGYPEWLGVLAEEFSGTFEIALAKPAAQLQHFIVCDSKIVRQENIHAELKQNSGAHEIKAEVNFNNPAKGKELESTFDALWAKSDINHVGSRKTPAPSWLIQRMEALQQRPRLTSQRMLEQWDDSTESSPKSESKHAAF